MLIFTFIDLSSYGTCFYKMVIKYEKSIQTYIACYSPNYITKALEILWKVFLQKYTDRFYRYN